MSVIESLAWPKRSLAPQPRQFRIPSRYTGIYDQYNPWLRLKHSNESSLNEFQVHVGNIDCMRELKPWSNPHQLLFLSPTSTGSIRSRCYSESRATVPLASEPAIGDFCSSVSGSSIPPFEKWKRSWDPSDQTSGSELKILRLSKNLIWRSYVEWKTVTADSSSRGMAWHVMTWYGSRFGSLTER
jgi:hypothetical protein